MQTKNKLDLLLLYPPHDVKFYQPIGLPQLAGYLLAQGHTVKILDSVVLGYNFDQVCSYIKESNPKIIGVSIPFTEMAKSGIEMLKICRKEFPDTSLISGGYHCSIMPEDVIDYSDFVVIGDGEVITSEIIRGQHSVKGILTGKPLQDVNSFPAWGLMPIEKYKMTLYLETGELAFPLQTGYGCPFSCTFCCNSKLHERVRYKDISHVIDEIKYVIQRFGVHGFHIWDETFTLNRKRVVEFCQQVIRNDLNIHWTAQTRANLLDKALLELMKQAGCVRISIGVESGDPSLVESINKAVKLQDAINAINLAKQVSLISYAGFMIGHPDETPESIARTISFASELDSDFVGFRCAIPYPGCVFRDIAEKQGGILTDDFSQYRDENIVYVPPGLAGYDLKKVRQLAYSYFYWHNTKRIASILKQNFVDMFNDTVEMGSSIYLSQKPIEKLIDQYCKVSV